MMRRPPSSSPPHTLFPSPTLFRSPVVWLDYDDRCPDRPTRALLLSELATFLAQIEANMGKRSLIASGPNFEADYQVTRGIARTTWLRRDIFPPDYGAHRSEGHKSELQSLMRNSYLVLCLTKKRVAAHMYTGTQR